MKGNAMMQSLIMIVAMLLLLAIFVSIIFGSKTKQIEMDFEEINLMKTTNTFSLLDKSLQATWSISSVQAVFRAGEEGLGCDAGSKPGYWFSMDRNKPRVPSLPAAGRKENYRDSSGKPLSANPQVCLPQDINTARYMKEVFEDYTNIPGSGGNDDAWCTALAKTESSPELYKCVNTVNIGPYGMCKPDTKIGWCVPGVVKCCIPEIDKPACSTDAVCKHYASATCKAQQLDAEKELMAITDEKTLKALGVESIDKVIYKPEGNDDCIARGHGTYCFCINPDEKADDRSGADAAVDVNGINTKLTPFSRFMWPSYENVKNDVVTQVKAEAGSTDMNSLIFHEYSTNTRFKDLVKAGWAVVDEAINLNNDFYTNSINFEGTSQSASVVKSRLAAASINLAGGSSALSNSVVGVPATVTAEKITSYLNQKAPALAQYANYFYEFGVNVKYDIDPAFAVAVAIQESGGVSNDAKNKNNFFGIGPGKSYPTPAAGIEAFYKLIKDRYVSQGQDTIEKMTAPGAYAGNTCKGPPASEYPCCKDFGGHCYCCHTVAEGQAWLTNVAKIRSEINEGASSSAIISSSGSITTEIKPNVEFEISKGNDNYLAAAQGIWMHYDAEVSIIESPSGARAGPCRQIPEAFKDIFKKSLLEKVWNVLEDNPRDYYIESPVYFFAAMAQFTNWKEDYEENNRYGLLAVPENKLEYCKDVLETDSIEGFSEDEKDSLLKKDVNLDCAIKIIKNLMSELDELSIYGLYRGQAEKEHRAKLALAAYWSDLNTVQKAAEASGNKWENVKLPEDAANYATSVWRYYQEYKEGCGVYGNFIWPLPLDYIHIGQCYHDPRPYALHSGIDISAPAGTLIYSIADGKVIYSCNGYCHGYGNTIMIQHGPLFVRYNHMLESPSVSVGSFVKQGDTIGKVGNTGYSFGNHLDMKVYSKKPTEFEYTADLDPVCIYSEDYLKQIRVTFAADDACKKSSQRENCGDYSYSGYAVAIEAGHAGSSGAHGLVEEEDVNQDVASRVKSKLETRGIAVVYDETNSYSKSKNDVFSKAQQSGAGLFISIHNNDADNSAAGTVFYQTNDFKDQSIKLANFIQPELNKVTGYSHKISPAGSGIGSRIYGDQAGMPFVLIEMSHVNDKRLKEDSFKDSLADAIVRGILQYSETSSLERQASQFTGMQLKETPYGFEKAPIILKFKIEDWLPAVDCEKSKGKQFMFDGTVYECGSDSRMHVIKEYEPD